MPVLHASTIGHAPDRPAYRLTTLGALGLALDCPEAEHPCPTILSAGKAIALVTYLHCSPGRSASRDHLIDQFWGDSDPAAGRHALRQLVLRLRKQLGPDAINSEPGRLTLTAPLRSDREDFLRAFEAGRYQAAAELYSGDFVLAFAAPGAVGFEQWADTERLQLRRAFLRATAEVVRQTLDEADHKSAVRHAVVARNLCPEEQATWRMVIEAYMASGNLPAALVELDGLLSMLRAMDGQPEPATSRLADRLRSAGQDGQQSVDGSDPLASPEMVGRAKAFSALTTAWQASQHSGARHLHVSAPAGLGKSRLLAELANRLSDGVGHLLTVRAVPGERQREGALLADLVTALATLGGAKSASKDSLTELGALAPTLSALLDPLLPRAAPQRTTTARTMALVDLMTSIAESRPLAILVDDLHWADDHSITVLQGTISRLGASRVLLVTASRTPRQLGGSDSIHTELALLPLSPTAVTALLTSLGADASDPWIEAFGTALHTSSGGSPLLVLNLLRLVLERDHLVITPGGRWAWIDAQAALASIGETDPVRRRVEALDAGPRLLLTSLAAAGAPLPVADMGQIPGVSVGDLQLLDQIGLVTTAAGTVRPAHDEVSAAALQLAAPAELRAIHKTLGASAARRLHADDGAFQRAARHFQQAGDSHAISRLFRQRARQARQRKEGLELQELAVQALGPDSARPAVRRLIRSIPPLERLMYAPPRRAALAALAMVLSAISVAGAVVSRGTMDAEAHLLVALKERPSHDRLALYRIPLSRDRWREGGAITPSEGKRWGRLPPEVAPYTGMAVSPDGRMLIFDMIHGDSGGIDLVLRNRQGRLTRLTDSPGDDFGPYWAPDGSGIVFATARWTPRGNDDADLAILELATGQVRQLTVGPDYDSHPKWSPDGARIAFTRRQASSPERLICWVVVGGGTEHCRRLGDGRSDRFVHWVSDSSLYLAREIAGQRSELVEWDLARDSVRLVIKELGGSPCTPTMDWILCYSPRHGAPEIANWDGRQLLTRRFADGIGLASVVGSWDNAGRTGDFLAQVQITDRNPAALLGVTHHLGATGFNSSGALRPVPAGVLRWSVRDTSLAAVNPASGVLTPRALGRTWIIATAGGWRTDSVPVQIEAPSSATAFAESWGDSGLTGWVQHGFPLPTVGLGPDGIPGFLNNGDSQFDSGAFSRFTLDGARGGGIEVLVSTPINALKWQSLKLSLGSIPGWIASGATGESVCRFDIPGGEGTRLVRFSAGVISQVLGGDTLFTRLSAGDWYSVRIQRFPDETCGLAINGIPLARGFSLPISSSKLAVTIAGQSVGTRMLVGPLMGWSGVRTDVDWSSLDLPAAGLKQARAPE